MNRFAFVLVAALSGVAQAQTTVSRPSLTLEGARKAIDAVVAEAHAKHAGGVVAVVDDGGNLIALERVDGTFAAGASISIGKARTAVMFKKPTRFFEELINKGRTAMSALKAAPADFTPLQGGVPIVVGGQIVGGIGVSGASSARQDEEFALVGANALAGDKAAQVQYIDRDQVQAAFQKGMSLTHFANYSVEASHRDHAGQAEVHETDTDIIYVLEGSAQLVTGGTVEGGQPIADHEVRGSAIRGGQSRRIAPGDVIVVPRGVPHQFAQLSGPINYYVVKVR